MAGSVANLVSLLDLDDLGEDRFVGTTPATSLTRVFGGQVLAQAFVAAARTVDRPAHSLHATFLRPGDPLQPLEYDVERSRDGRSFSTRRIVARQAGVQIFHMTVGYQDPQEGFEHADPMPDVPAPEELPSSEDREATPEDRWERYRADWASIEVRPVQQSGSDTRGVGHVVRRQVWFKVADRLSDDEGLHRAALVYASDLTLLGATLLPHGYTIDHADISAASLDHVMWLHRPARSDEWLLYDQNSPSASGGRGLAGGRIFTRDGQLVSTVMQEGMIRLGRRSPRVGTEVGS